MPVAQCPECEDGLAWRTGTEVRDGTVIQFFECRKCEHQWTEPL